MLEAFIECDLLLDKIRWCVDREQEILNEILACPFWRFIRYLKLNKKFNAMIKINADNFAKYDMWMEIIRAN